MLRRVALAAALLMTAVLTPEPSWAQPKLTVSHGLTLLDALKYGPEFRHYDYVNPAAPKGGSVRLHAIGTFDTFNPFVIKGVPAAGINLVFETLMTGALDDLSAEYGLIAESVEVPDDLSYAVYNLRAAARFHDGTPITAADVVFSFETLKAKGAPHYRFYYGDVARAEAIGAHKVKFHFSGPKNRELPQIVGQLPVLSKKYWEGREFDTTTLERPVGSGPYRVSQFEPGRHVVYERVVDHWAREVPAVRGQYNFDQVRFEYFRDPTIALEAFKAHAYDYRNENSALTWATGYDFPAARADLVKKAELRHERPSGMQGFVFNLRREKFRDRRVREALGYAFDFEWSNKNLFFDQYTRTTSFFANSELAAVALPSPEELAFLEPLRGRIPDEVFTMAYQPPATDGSGNIRENLRRAQTLLRQAGWAVRDNKLIDPQTNRPLEIEFLLVSPQFERIVAPFIRNLERLGVTGKIRTVDPAQYQNRERDFDFDVVVETFPQSNSPGNEQRDFWSAASADRPGGRNLIGLKDPAIDRLVEQIIGAPDRKTLIAATRALDRVLLWGHYVVPQWHVQRDRIAYWDKFGRPAVAPRYGVGFFTWWVDPEKEAKLKAAEAQSGR